MKRKTGVYILLVILAVVFAGGFIAYRSWTKPHEKAEDLPGVRISAVELGTEYARNETAANGKFLNKVLEVDGIISEIENNQDGGTMAILQSNDPLAGVQCTFREKNIDLKKGQHAIIKGFCSGNSLMGVTLTDCVVKQ